MPDVQIRHGIVTAVAGDRVTVRVGGSTVDIPDVPHIDGYLPTVGHSVWALQEGPALLVLGRTGPGENPGTSGRPPTGPAGGVLAGTYPAPTFSADMATQAELDAASALLVAKALVDAKGDLIVATAADTPARLAVGANGRVLTADSGASTGVSWQVPAAVSATSVLRDARWRMGVSV